MLIFWIVMFLAALVVMVKGADWFLEAAEIIGLKIGLSPFVVGVVIVGVGTSFPELISSFVALIQGATEIVVANAVGSNIANILLIVGLSAIVGRRLVVTKSLIDLDLPLLAVTTVLFLGTAWDGSITTIESLFLIVAYAVYLAYTFIHEDDTAHEVEKEDILPGRADRRKHVTKPKTPAVEAKECVGLLCIGKLLLGLLGLIFGAKYLIDSVIAGSAIIGIGAGAIALFAVALGTSLPEVLVSVKAAFQKKSEIALGNIFGSNVFNILVVIGLPGIFKTLTLDQATFSLGLPVLIVATLLFIISGISRRIHMWEGWLYVVVYIFFIGKLFNLL